MMRKTMSVQNRAFTLVELLVVILVIAILAAIAIPKFTDVGIRSKEASLKSNLKLLRNSVELFRNDTSAYPSSLASLAATAAPTTGLSAAAASATISATEWKGPYLMAVPTDPVSIAAFTYSVSAGTVGKVSSSATGNGLDGTAYSSW